MADDNAVIRRRRRPAKSCENCRKRKLRCDRELPCKPCKRSRNDLQCTYGSDSSRPLARGLHQDQAECNHSTHVHGHISEPNNQAVTHLSHSELLGHTNPNPSEGSNDSLNTVVDNNVHTTQQDNTIRELKHRLANVEKRLAEVTSGIASTAYNNNNGNGNGNNSPTFRPHLRADHLETDKTRMFGRSHWMHALEQFHVLSRIQSKPRATFQSEMHRGLGPLMKDAVKLRVAIKSSQGPRLQEPLPDLISTLPAREICDQLVDNYLRLFEPMFRIVHKTSFRQDYQSFWDDPPSSKTSFVMKLAMILAIGVIFHRDRTEADQIRVLAHSWVYAAEWWFVGPTERWAMNLDGVQVFCLLILARQASSFGGSTAIVTEALFKLSFTLGLHLDPNIFPSVSKCEREIRRRLWLTVLELLMMNSLDTTLPLLISADDFDCLPPSNMNDDDLQVSDGTVGAARPSSEVTEASIQLLLQKSLRCRLNVVRKLNGIRRLPSYEETLQIGNELKGYCGEISAFFHSVKSSVSAEEDLAAAEFHRRFLDCYMRRYVLLLHRPWALKAKKDPRFYLARKICFESSQIMASLADSVQLPRDDALDEFALLAVRGSGLFKGPLNQDVIVTLCLELKNQLDDEKTAAAASTAADPLVQLSRASRQPVIGTLRHIREQLRQIIALGRPSCKRYIMVATMLAYVEAVEDGHADPNAEIHDALERSVRDAGDLLRLSGACGAEGGQQMSVPEYSFDADWFGAFGILGFDPGCYDLEDPSMTIDQLLTPSDFTENSTGVPMSFT